MLTPLRPSGASWTSSSPSASPGTSPRWPPGASAERAASSRAAALDAAARRAAGDAARVGWRRRAWSVVSNSSPTRVVEALDEHVEVARSRPGRRSGRRRPHRRRRSRRRRAGVRRRAARPGTSRSSGRRRRRAAAAGPGTLVTRTSCGRRTVSAATRTPSTCRVAGAKPAMSVSVRASTARPLSRCALVDRTRPGAGASTRSARRPGRSCRCGATWTPSEDVPPSSSSTLIGTSARSVRSRGAEPAAGRAARTAARRRPRRARRR